MIGAYGPHWGHCMDKLDPLVAALLSGGVITGIVALAGHFITLWNSEQEARRQREIENEREQDAALQEYINNMKAMVPDLLYLRDVYRGDYDDRSELNHLAKEIPKHEVPLLQRLGRYRLQLRQYLERVRRNQVAKEREANAQEFRRLQELALRVGESQTIAILLRVTGPRKRVPLTLLHTLGLIHREWPVLELGRPANLMHADLTDAILPKVFMKGINLKGADLKGADLSGSDLSYADLRGANLTNADLSYADLSGANLLPYDEEDPARLSLHNLKDHALPSEELLGFLAEQQEKQRLVKLERPQSRIGRRLRIRRSRRMRTKAVTFTNLTDTKLEGASLTGAILANADLREVRGLTPEQVNTAIGNDKTHLPRGLNPPNQAWKEESIEDQIKKLGAANFNGRSSRS
jgi:hypothetical protein